MMTKQNKLRTPSVPPATADGLSITPDCCRSISFSLFATYVRGFSQLSTFSQVYKMYAFPDPLPSSTQCTTKDVVLINQTKLFPENIHERFLILSCKL